MTHQSVAEPNSAVLQEPVVFDPVQASCDAAVIWLHGFGDGPENWAATFKPLRTSWATWPPAKHWKWLHLHAPLLVQPCYDDVLIPAWAQLSKIDCLHLADLGAEYSNTLGLFLSSVAAVKREVEQLLKAGVSARRIVLGGVGQGAAIAMQTVLSFGVPLAGCIVFSGWMTPDVFKMLRNGKPPDTPFLMCHGTDDDIVSIDCGCAARDALEGAGVKVEFVQYTGLGHGACAAELQAMAMFLQSCLSHENDAPPIDWEEAPSSSSRSCSESEDEESEDEPEAMYVCKEALAKMIRDVKDGHSLCPKNLQSLKGIDDLPDEALLVPLRIGLIEEIVGRLEANNSDQTAVDCFLQSAEVAVDSSEDTELTARAWRSFVKAQVVEGT